MENEQIPILKIEKILDKTTFVITGKQIHLLRKDTELYVLFVQRDGVKKDIPLVLPKAKLVVTLAAGLYVIGRPPVEIREEPSGFGAFTASLQSTRKIMVRPAISVEESQMVGNPSQRPIELGDVVIRENDLESFVEIISNSPDHNSYYG